MKDLFTWFMGLFGPTVREDIQPTEEEDALVKEDTNKSKTLLIERTYYKKGVASVATFPSGFQMHMIERPWNDNEKGKSCIPEGTYDLSLEVSPLIERLTNKSYKHGWTVKDVPGRTYIRFHQANYPKQLEGCIAMGNPSFQGSVPVVWKSREAFSVFMHHMKKSGITRVVFVQKDEEPYRIDEVPST